MTNFATDPWQTRHIPLFLGVVLGFLGSIFFLSGDQYGQVNILVLLGLFVGVPVLGGLLSLLPLVNLEPPAVHQFKARLFTFWGRPIHHNDERLDKLSVLYHGQYVGVGFGLGSLLALLLLLVFTDMHFVWRSTLLTPQLLLPVLQVLSLPWFFWQSAQPTMELLTATQDSRLTVDAARALDFKKWWPFVMACQLCYGFILRLVMMAIIRWRIAAVIKMSNKREAKRHRHVATTKSFSNTTNQLPDKVVVLNWASFADATLTQLNDVIKKHPVITAGPFSSKQSSLDTSSHYLVLVKAWEPPLQELKDYLQHCKGVIYPVELQREKVSKPKPHHLQEWQRFTETLQDWAVYVEEETL
ncbi:DUF2868 domain-containing protein [Planctobacterium marinum]|uniref:DUF2868 domain-containing protein n=1 Tax=Planctobacterium marinum TaxID=1631968 RepID=UPI0030C76359